MEEEVDEDEDDKEEVDGSRDCTGATGYMLAAN